MKHTLCLLSFFFAALMVIVQPLAAQTVVTEEGLLRLVKGGASETLIIKAISMATAVEVDPSLENTVSLMGKGVSQPVMDALVKRKAELSSSSAMLNSAASPTPNISGGASVCVLQDRTEVRLVVKEGVSSATAKQGDPVKLSVGEDVSVNGVVVITKGAEAKGHVTEAESKGRWGKSGKLLLSVDSVKAVDGTNIRLEAVVGDNSEKKNMAAMMVGLSGALKKGKDIEISAGTVVKALTDGDRRVSLKPAPPAPSS